MPFPASFFYKVYRANSPVYFFFVTLTIFLVLDPVSAGGQQFYLEELLKAAREKHLSDARYWDILVHYKRDGSDKKSLIDDPRFFLAADGKVNPAAELEATLVSFFQEERKDEEHPLCRFVARYAWLSEQLDIDKKRLPGVVCTEFDTAMAAVNAHSATLIFPTTLNNSPASMFGHTLIRIDSEKQNRLLSHAVTYGADATDSNGFLYAFKGMFGYYHGYFSILPYYDKVAEYSNIEHRDIWEYQLNLTPEEVRRMTLHIWEVRDIYSDYYFFDENCSFDLLLLLEAARPALHLSDVFWDNKLSFWVIPVETIRIIKEEGLVTRAIYRPSHARRITAISDVLSGEGRQTALDLVNRKTPLQNLPAMTGSPEEKIKILDLTAELLQYNFAGKKIEKESYLKQFLPVLSSRSSLGKQADDAYAVPPPREPDLGHLSGKFSSGAGYRTDSLFAEIRWRPAYHDLMDPDEGYSEGAQINFFDVSGRYFFDFDSIKLEQFHLIDIVSLSPRNDFFKPVSWKVNTGWDRKLLRDGKDHLIYRLNPGAGLSYMSKDDAIFYVMAESDLNVSGALEDNYSLGFGASAGILGKATRSWKIKLSMTALYYEAGDEHKSIEASLLQNFMINSNNSIQFALSREKTNFHYRTESFLIWSKYL